MVLDAGLEVHRSERLRVGLFVGWRRSSETVNAHGCVQTAGSSDWRS